MICPECQGFGDKYYDCPICDGSGEGMSDKEYCMSCHGTGERLETCIDCNGSGNIDLGINDDEKSTLKSTTKLYLQEIKMKTVTIWTKSLRGIYKYNAKRIKYNKKFFEIKLKDGYIYYNVKDIIKINIERESI